MDAANLALMDRAKQEKLEFLQLWWLHNTPVKNTALFLGS